MTRTINQEITIVIPAKAMLQLSIKEKKEVVANCDHLAQLKYSATLPYAFTEHGAIMLANLLNSERAIKISVFIVRAFVKLRKFSIYHKELEHKFIELENKIGTHDKIINSLVSAIRELIQPKKIKPKRSIGFSSWTKE
jgi:hypothetical protein